MGPKVLEFKNVQEGWLRIWGREEDANTLRGEIEELMWKDEIDQQLDGDYLLSVVSFRLVGKL